ncbi:MAG: NADH-quinone oxidoreductase subunit J [Legionellaceae bacterium]|nr:NADH-quinone oxidoreductase subunit J [Legionellaceae bacterium]
MHDLLIQVVFYGFAALAVFSALMVITQNNPVRCVLFLVLTFFASSVLWILAQAEFLALILVLVYVGAVMTLFLFVVMMLNIDVESIKSHLTRYLPFGLILVAFLSALLLVSLPQNFSQHVQQLPESQVVHVLADTVAESERTEVSNTVRLGRVLYTDYILAFELAAILLLVAIISAITLVHRGVRRSRHQDIREQIMTRRDERVRLVRMHSENNK